MIKGLGDFGEVDGHDMGAGEMNIFVLTDQPQPAFDRIKVLIGAEEFMRERAGHADLSTTMRYMHLSPASLNQAIRLLEQRPPLRGEKGESGTPPQEIRAIPSRKVASPQRFELYQAS